MFIVRSIRFKDMLGFETELNKLIQANKGFKFKSILSKTNEEAEIMLEQTSKQILKD